MNVCEQNGESWVRQREPVEPSPKQSSQIGILGLNNNAHMGNFFRSGDVFKDDFLPFEWKFYCCICKLKNSTMIFLPLPISLVHVPATSETYGEIEPHTSFTSLNQVMCLKTIFNRLNGSLTWYCKLKNSNMTFFPSHFSLPCTLRPMKLTGKIGPLTSYTCLTQTTRAAYEKPHLRITHIAQQIFLLGDAFETLDFSKDDLESQLSFH